MAYLIERKARVLFITASLVRENGKRRKIVIEIRPEYAVITLQGMKEQFPICWDAVFETARRRHEENLRLEAKRGTLQKTKGKSPRR